MYLQVIRRKRKTPRKAKILAFYLKLCPNTHTCVARDYQNPSAAYDELRWTFSSAKIDECEVYKE